MERWSYRERRKEKKGRDCWRQQERRMKKKKKKMTVGGAERRRGGGKTNVEHGETVWKGRKRRVE